MINQNKLRELWRSNWLHSINKLTDLDYQRNHWLDHSNINPHFTFMEFMCSYFDDLSLSSNDNNKGYISRIEEGLLTYDEYKIIEKWHNELNNYSAPNNEDINSEIILKDEKWIQIVKQGKESFEKLLKFINEANIE
jgi:hypothetical protein